LEAGERPRADAQVMRVLQPSEFRALLDAASPRYRLVLETAIFTGVRRGELLGLRWCDVDLEAGEIHVRNQLGRDGKLTEPKTAAAKRTIPLVAGLARRFAQHRQHSPFNQQSDFVFVTGTGKPLEGRNLLKRGLKPALKAAGLVGDGQPSVRLHDLRHTYASMM